MPGKRFQIYLTKELADRLRQIARYERSAEVQKALRQYWGMTEIDPNDSQIDSNEDEKHPEK